jgi:MFS family permease
VKRRLPVPAQFTEDVSIIRNGNFNRLWSAQILSQIAQNLLNFALIIRVFQLAQGTRLANVSVALLILSFGFPSIFFAAAAGVYVDHWNKKKVLLIVNFLRAALVLGYLAFEHNLWMVFLLSFLISTTTQFFTPAEAAAIPALVTKSQLLRANSLFVFTLYASFIVGYSGSGPVIAAFTARGPYVLTSIMFALAGLLVWFLPNMHIAGSKATGFLKVVRLTGHELRANWRLIRTTHHLSFPIIELTLAQSLLGVIMVLAPALSQAVLGMPLQDSSHYFIFPAGIGMITGVALIGRLSKRLSHMRLIAIGGIVAAAALMLLGLANNLHHAGHGSFSLMRYQIGLIVAPITYILGLSYGTICIAAQTILQEHTDESSRGKVFGALGMMGNIAATLPVFFAGIFADLTSVQAVFTTLGAILLVFCIGQYALLSRRGKLA